MSTLTARRIVGGIPRCSLPWWLIQSRPEKKTLLVVPTEEDVLDIVDSIGALFRLPETWNLPPTISAAGYLVDDDTSRGPAVHHWLFGKTDVLVASNESLSLPIDEPAVLRKKSVRLAPGFTMTRPKFEEVLAAAGYTRNDWTEQVGEYAIRGDVIDIWPAGETSPLRITWNFDSIEALRVIDLHTQRSDEYQRELMLCPVTPGTGATIATAVSDDVDVIYFESDTDQPDVDQLFPRGYTLVRSQPTPDSAEGFERPPAFAGNINMVRDQLIKWHDDDWTVAVFCHNPGERDRLDELLVDPVASMLGQRPPWFPQMIIGELEHGFVQPTRRQAVITNSEIFGRYRKRMRLPKFEGGGGALSSYLDIKPNDFLVHEKYGIGRYAGLKTLRVGGVTSEYLQIEYKGGDKLYVPIFELQQVQKYLGAEGKRPALSSLDTAAWERVKAKVHEDVAKLAADLLKKAAKRTIRPGYSFPPRTHLEEEFARSFIYPLTDDQRKTLDEVESDMTAPKSMDRLICGDVGFGKTEIAMRAALKCALAGKQVALLCPTTILAEQHARNFSERMADYPVTVRLISRFQEKSDQKKIIEALAKGGVDIVIGTHRLLSADVHFKDLGLIVIDEEHRFGVKQKNKLLALRETVDVLSLTATPIPRTLASAVGGIKDLSIIETPPQGRLPISTHVGLFDEDVMVKAVQTELDRAGQVFYVHNRVKTLLARKQWLEGVLPSIRIVMAHGQMREHELEKAMHAFLHRKADVLLATTIIESGLDIPSVNTLIVEEAEEMGLAQLYQLRGRVGRSAKRAYCYLFYSHHGMTSDAKKRLEALKEFTSLGSGFRLAMRDMEIRGAGNLLGPQQHGNMAAVGVETYSRLLNEEIQKQKGEEYVEEIGGPQMELNISAYFPEDYMPSEPLRVQTYKRMLSASADDLPKIKEEIKDRFGTLPEPAKVLFDTAALRLKVQLHGITEVHQEAEAVLIYFRKGFKLPDAAFQRLLDGNGKDWDLIPGDLTGVRVHFEENQNVLDALGGFLRRVFPN